MPIYAYRCAACGHAQDVLRKISDPALTTCPACQSDSFEKQVTAAGFQLKGSGWYVTDFKGGGGTAKPAVDTAAPAAAKPEAAASTAAATPTASSSSGSDGGGSAT